MSHLQYLDELIKEYLCYRGFTSTLRSFDNDLKIDKDKGFRVDRITDQISNFIHSYDLNGLRDLWSHLDQHLFIRLPAPLLPCRKKLELDILKLYVINTIQNNKTEKLLEFFEKMAADLQNQSEWRDWFVLPYLKNVEENTTFSMYFSRHWQDTLFVSFQNFLSIIFQNLPLPIIARCTEESTKISELQKENELLKTRLASLITSDQIDQISVPEAPSSSLLMDDFFIIAQQTQTSEASKSLKNILFNLGGALPSSSSTSQFTKPQTAAVSHSRRATSQAPPEERRKQRSSSLAPASSRGSEHTPIKRISQGPSHISKSPTKPDYLSDMSLDNLPPNEIPSPFLLLEQEFYMDHRAVVTHALFNSSGSVVASADTDGVVKIWTPSPSPKTECGVVMKGAFSAVDWFSRNEKLLLLASKSGCVRIYDSQEKKIALDIGPDAYFPFKDNKIMCAKVSPSESSVLLSVASKAKKAESSANLHASTLHLLDLKTQKFDTLLKMDKSTVNTCVFNHNSGLLLCGCSDGFIRIVDIRTFEIVASWFAHQGEIFTIKLSPQEDRIYSLGSDNMFAAWSLAQTGTQIIDHCFRESAAGPFLVSMGSDGSIGGHPSSSPSRPLLLRPYGSLFALHNDDKHILTCSPTGPIIYKIGETYLSEVMSLGGHKSPVLTLDLSSAHQCGLCIAASLDGKVSISTILPC